MILLTDGHVIQTTLNPRHGDFLLNNTTIEDWSVYDPDGNPFVGVSVIDSLGQRHQLYAFGQIRYSLTNAICHATKISFSGTYIADGKGLMIVSFAVDESKGTLQ